MYLLGGSRLENYADRWICRRYVTGMTTVRIFIVWIGGPPYLANSMSDSVTSGTLSFFTSRTFRGGAGH